MKKILILLSVAALSLDMFAGDGDSPICEMELNSFYNVTYPLDVWGQDYQSCEYFEWNLTFPTHWDYVDFDYTVDFNPTEAIDDIKIFVKDENGIEREILHYAYQPITGRVTVPLYGHTGRVVYTSLYGNTGGIYNGFKLYYREGHVNNSNHVFLSDVGIGTYPKEPLHVNGAIRGGGINGEVTFKGDNGSITIGAPDTQTMVFDTDRSKFVFNKPINGSGPYGSLNITTTTGYLEFGPMDAGNIRFKTNMTGYYFDKTIMLGNGTLSSAAKMTFKTNNTTNCMTLATNGNVGIGTTSPSYKLDVAGAIRANEIIVNTTGADFVFADDYQLRPLSEVKAFITENKHLPEIKSAQEMQENGVGINELQTQLLQKIEELTLYLIQQEQIISELRQEVEYLKQQ